MGEFMQTPLGILLGVGLIVGLAWVFVFRKWGTRGSGIGGQTAPPQPPVNPLGNKTPSVKPPVRPRKPID